MFQLILISYRLFAAIVILIPLIVNLTIKGDVIASFIYAPSVTLLALVLAIYFDGKITDKINQKITRSEHNTLTIKLIHARLCLLFTRFTNKRGCY